MKLSKAQFENSELSFHQMFGILAGSSTVTKCTNCTSTTGNNESHCSDGDDPDENQK